MAGLWWNSKRLTLSSALGSIGEYKNVVANELPKYGFTNVQNQQLDVNGEKNNHIISVAHFYIGGRDFWEVVMCGGADVGAAKTNVDEVTGILAKLVFL